jgi:hypothetical protein
MSLKVRLQCGGAWRVHGGCIVVVPENATESPVPSSYETSAIRAFARGTLSAVIDVDAFSVVCRPSLLEYLKVYLRLYLCGFEQLNGRNCSLIC